MTPEQQRDLAIATAFRRLAEGDVHDLSGLAADLIEDCTAVLGVAAAGLMLTDSDGRLRVIASSSEELHTLELFEVQAGEGPCPESFRTGLTVSVTEAAELAARWPHVAARAAALSLGAAYAVPVRHQTQVVGALNLFAAPGRPLDGSRVALAEALAVSLAARVADARLVDAAQTLAEQLQSALTSRVTIEQAKGIVAATLDLDLQSSFDLLRGHARHHGLRLSDVAADVAGRRLAPDLLLAPRPRLSAPRGKD